MQTITGGVLLKKCRVGQRHEQWREGAGFRASNLLRRQLIIGRWQFLLGERDTDGDPSEALFLESSTEVCSDLSCYALQVEER